MNHEKKAINVAILDHSPEIGGAEVSVLTLSRNIDRSRFNVTVILPSKGNFSRELDKNGIPTNIIPLPLGLIRLKRGKALRSFLLMMVYSFYFYLFLIKLCIYLKRKKFDVILTNTVKAHLYGSVAAFLCGIPVVWRFHDLLSPEDFSPTLIKLIVFFGDLFPRKILAVSKMTEAFLIKSGLKGDKIEVIFSGIDQGRFDSSNLSDIRHELGIRDGTRLVGCIGRIIAQKGQKIFLLSIPDVIRKHPGTFFLIIGDVFLKEKGYKEELLRIIREKKIEDHIGFTGFRNDIDDLIRSLDILVFSSVAPESFGLSIVEAMFLGKPVIATNVGGVSEIIEDGFTGMLVKPDHPEEISDRIVHLFSNPKVYDGIAQRAKEVVTERFSLQKYVAAMEKAFKEITNPPQPPFAKGGVRGDYMRFFVQGS